MGHEVGRLELPGGHAGEDPVGVLEVAVAALHRDEDGVGSGVGTRSMGEWARLLGGDLQVESVPGRGTRVRFEMTLKKDDEEPGEGEEAEEEARVLLVEDHATVRDALLSMFEEETGLEVVGQAEVHNRNVDRLCLKHPARLG